MTTGAEATHLPMFEAGAVPVLLKAMGGDSLRVVNSATFAMSSILESGSLAHPGALPTHHDDRRSDAVRNQEVCELAAPVLLATMQRWREDRDTLRYCAKAIAGIARTSISLPYSE